MFDLNGYLRGVLKKDTSNALSPLLWLAALIGLPSLIGSYFSEGPFRYVLFLLGATIVVYIIFKYEELVKKDPRLLMSERTQVEMMKLDIIQEKGGEIQFDMIDIPLGEDPKSIQSSNGGSK